MFHFTARWQLLTGVPTVQSGQDNLEVLMSDRHQITEDSKETPTQHLTHNIYSIHGDFGEEGRRTYEDVHVWMKLVFRIKNMNIHMFWKYFDICDIFCSFLKISYRIFLKSTVSCCCHPKDTSILSPSCWLQHGKKNLCFLRNEQRDIWDLLDLSILDSKIRRSITFRDKEESEFSEIATPSRMLRYDHLDAVLQLK